jgi:microcin C transport system ATP-binding protein
MVQTPLLQISNLDVHFRSEGGEICAVNGASFTLEAGRTLSLVGESGSGKSVTAHSIMQLLPYPTARHSARSSITFDGDELIGASDTFMRNLRGKRIGMIFQEPLTALNPLHKLHKQIGEALMLHQGLSREAARARIPELLEMVGLDQLKDRLEAYPHELSGGQRQRIMIAMAIANSPDLLIADEPTTALDVTVQAQILELLQDLKSRLNMALLLITHDLTVVEKMADDVCVMKDGEIVEAKPARDLFAHPEHSYTQMLLAAQPSGSAVATQGDATPLLECRGLSVQFPKGKSLLGKPREWIPAVDQVDLTCRSGQTLGVVGESGSGKSTLGFTLLRLLRPSGGTIIYNGADITRFNRKQMRRLRHDMQIVFQDPFGSLSPRMSVAEIIAEGLKVHYRELSQDEREARVIQALEDVRLDPATRWRYPHEFSGGQRQRIAIARTLVLRPSLLVLDEPTSALDLSVQSQIVDLLRELQAKYAISYLFISHDLRVVRAMAHEILVMKDGRIIESGPSEQIFETPQEPYTQALMEAAIHLKARYVA